MDHAVEIGAYSKAVVDKATARFQLALRHELRGWQNTASICGYFAGFSSTKRTVFSTLRTSLVSFSISLGKPILREGKRPILRLSELNFWSRAVSPFSTTLLHASNLLLNLESELSISLSIRNDIQHELPKSIIRICTTTSFYKRRFAHFDSNPSEHANDPYQTLRSQR